MTEYEGLAQEVVEIVNAQKNTTPTEAVNKLALERGLSKEAQQRLVEETNIGLFLDKMKDGTHYEDFELANPAVIDVSSSSGSRASLNKEARYKGPQLDASAFCLTDLPKEAKASAYPRRDINEDIYNMHLKTEEIEAERLEMDELQKIAAENAVENIQYENWYAGISRSIRGDADLVKTACAYFQESNPELLDEILHETTLTLDEIKNGSVSYESIEQLGKVAESEQTTPKPRFQSFKNSASDTLELLKYPFKNPKTAIGLAAAGYAVTKAVRSEREAHERRAMMVPNND